jgi:hypothetical protein
MVTVPMLLFNLVLLGLIVTRREPNTRQAIEDEGAIYIDINATTFTTVASLASTIAALLGGFLVLLAAFPAGRMMGMASRDATEDDLPTSYQLMVMMEIRAGSVWPTVFRLCKYFTSYRQGRAPISGSLILLSIVMMLGVVMR